MRVLDSEKALTITITGAVQGVGFRPFVFTLAQKHHLKGHVKNTPNGVLIFAQGNDQSIDSFLMHLRADAPPLARIQDIRTHPAALNGCKNFKIIHSKTDGVKSAIILPDMSTCADCLEEITDPKNRRYQYPFTNCTNCGPRFSIIQDLPYDRPHTSMSNFIMCQSCQQEYDNPSDRRFHAQPNACTECGPQLSFWEKGGKVVSEKQESLITAINAIAAGKIIALKGLGGFQLLCDARNKDAVKLLRQRKNRPMKPFAIMVENLDVAKRLCIISPEESTLITTPEKPIVILTSKGMPDVVFDVAPDNPTLGVMLPYTPLHHLLMQGLGFPIVATSGNLANEPICIDESEALERLGGFADGLLVHDRPIVRPVDDSVVRWMAGKKMVIRRARGFAPFPMQFTNSSTSILATGAHLKNSVTLTRNNQYFVSQHIGNLESDLSAETQKKVSNDLINIYDLNLRSVACDLHPDYASTAFAKSLHLPVYPVQHHLAHVWSVIAEHHLDLPVLGVAWDGTGLGTDSKIWGSEFFNIGKKGWKRIAHLKPFRLPGGDAAAREPRRSALGLLYNLWGSDAFLHPAIKTTFNEIELELLQSMFTSNSQLHETTSMGRFFDAVSFLTGFNHTVQFEGQAAMDLEFSIGEESTQKSYPISIVHEKEKHILDWSTMIESILEDVDMGVPRAIISAQFHQALSNVIVVMAELSKMETVCLSGGCFQNKTLLEQSVKKLKTKNVNVYWNRDIPINDGGISLGQAAAFYHGGQAECV